jgi:hypothetical protein
MQLDVGSGNPIAVNAFTQIMNGSVGVVGFGNNTGWTQANIVDLIYKAKTDASHLTKTQRDFIDAALAANMTIIDQADAQQLTKVMDYVNGALAAAALNPNGPGELNSTAPNPQFITELAAWGNRTNGLAETIAFLKTTSDVSQAVYESEYLSLTLQFLTSNETVTSNAQQVANATSAALNAIGATVTSFYLTPQEANSLTSNAEISSGSNYLAINKDSSGNVVGTLWSFSAPGTSTGAVIPMVTNGTVSSAGIPGTQAPLPTDPSLPYKEFTCGTESIRIYGNGVLWLKNTQTGMQSWRVPDETTGGTRQLTQFANGQIIEQLDVNNVCQGVSFISSDGQTSGDAVTSVSDNSTSADTLAQLSNFLRTEGGFDNNTINTAINQATQSLASAGILPATGTSPGYGATDYYTQMAEWLRNDSVLDDAAISKAVFEAQLRDFLNIKGGGNSVNAAINLNGAITSGVSPTYINNTYSYLTPFYASNGTLFYYDNGASCLAPPVVLDLNGNGIELISKADSHAYYDVTGDGLRHNIGWVSPNDGILVIDENKDGVIDKADELSFALWTPDNPNDTDIEALKIIFDTNNNGMIDSGDARFNDLRIWQDLNGDGVSDAGELKVLAGNTSTTLVQSNIVSVNLTVAPVNWASGGNLVSGFTTFTKTDQNTGWAADVGLGYDMTGWQASATPADTFVRMTQSGGLVYGLSKDLISGTTGSSLNLNLSDNGLAGAVGGAGNDAVFEMRRAA